MRRSALWSATAALSMGAGCRLWAVCEGDPELLDFNGFSNSQGILKFDAEIPNCAVHLRVP